MINYNKNFNLIKEITITGMLTGLSVILFFIGRFIPPILTSFLVLDFSTISLTMIYIRIRNFRGLLYSIVGCIIVGSFGFAIPTTSFDWIGPLINIISNSFYVVLFILFFNIFFKTIFHKINPYIKLMIVLSTTWLLTSFLLFLLNGLIFTPMYWYFFPFSGLDITTISFIEISELYNKTPTFALLYIPNYWLGIFTIFFGFNIIKFGINSILLFFVLYAFKNSNFGFNIISKKIESKNDNN